MKTSYLTSYNVFTKLVVFYYGNWPMTDSSYEVNAL